MCCSYLLPISYHHIPIYILPSLLPSSLPSLLLSSTSLSLPSFLLSSSLYVYFRLWTGSGGRMSTSQATCTCLASSYASRPIPLQGNVYKLPLLSHTPPLPITHPFPLSLSLSLYIYIYIKSTPTILIIHQFLFLPHLFRFPSCFMCFSFLLPHVFLFLSCFMCLSFPLTTLSFYSIPS